ncbi:MAG: dihydrodipicolinate synthase family protein [Verrucomicrobia bacterium]|nr:dihydrodipicolinate synthase family protein [Verrucomicrobiota bacterium]
MDDKWKGILPALWTPCDAAGALQEAVLRKNLRFFLDRGVHGILALGSTGEFLHLDTATKCRVMDITLAEATSVPVIINVSDIRPKEAARMATAARSAGAAAITMLPPYFFPVAQADLVEFFLHTSDAAQLPLFLYNFPERTGNRIDLETIAAVADRAPLVGVKQSGGEFGYHKDLVALGKERGFVVLTGSDTRLAEAMDLGVTGCVSGLSNAVPEITVGIFEAIKRGDPAAAATGSARMKAIDELINQLEFPSNISAIIEARGLNPGAPKTLVSESTRTRYAKLLTQFRDLFRSWNLPDSN